MNFGSHLKSQGRNPKEVRDFGGDFRGIRLILGIFLFIFWLLSQRRIHFGGVLTWGPLTRLWLTIMFAKSRWFRAHRTIL